MIRENLHKKRWKDNKSPFHLSYFLQSDKLPGYFTFFTTRAGLPTATLSEIVKKDLKFTEEENIIRCGITLEISENIGYEKETEFAGT